MTRCYLFTRDSLIGLDADDESLSRLLWAIDARDARDAPRGYFIDLALRRYDAAMAMSLPSLVDGVVEEVLESASREGIAELQVSAVAWYEFSRGPRTPEQLAVARALFGPDGVVPLSEELAGLAADVFRQVKAPRRRAADVAIGVTAAAMKAVLLTRNAKDFAGIPDLRLKQPRG